MINTVRLSKQAQSEPLRGRRMGERSIPLNRSYRAIYTIALDGVVNFVSIEEVHKHDY